MKEKKINLTRNQSYGTAIKGPTKCSYLFVVHFLTARGGIPYQINRNSIIMNKTPSYFKEIL